MGVNKVEYGSNTLVDLTGDTVTPEALLRGITAHNAAGNQIVGTGSGGGGGSMEDTEDLIKRTVGWVGKNLFAISDDYSNTGYGVTKVMDREAGTVTLNGTATADHNFTLWFDADETHFTTKSYTLSELGLDLEKTYKIIVENASANCYFTISDYRSSVTYLEITDSDPVTFTFAELGVTSTTKLMNHIRIAQNATFNNAVIKVMITESQYTDEFEPNHPPATEYFPRFIVCETEAEWEALSQAEKDDPNTYWVRPWADTVAFATDKTPVGAVLSVATGKTGDNISGITTPTGTFPTDDYLVCDGQHVSPSAYPALAKYFQTHYKDTYYFGGTAPGDFLLPNWSSDFPSNGVLVMKARESSNAMTITEIDDTSVSTDKTWSSQKIDTKASKSIITSNDVFDPTKAYAAGDWLIHNNILYEVLVACTGVTPPNATYYDPITLHELKNRIDALESVSTSTISRGTVAGAAIGGTLDHNTIRKVGNTVFASARLWNIGGISDRTTCYPFVVPEAYKPKVDTYISVSWQLTGSTAIYVGNVVLSGATGNVSFNYMVTDADKSKVSIITLLGDSWSVL